jgi:putative SOS response-associated peptidase YedK
MCGRFVCSSPLRVISQVFGVEQPHLEFEPNYNTTPTQKILIINNEGRKQIVYCKWGFLPSWAKDPAVGNRMINARAETVATKPAFRSAFKKRRCLIVADGFFEWLEEGRRKVPVYIRLTSNEPFGFAGLYNTWISPEGEAVCTCTIITTEANRLLKEVHDRMPVIVPRDREDFWLDPMNEDHDSLLTVLKAYPSEEMEYYRVSPRMNSPAFKSPDNVVPVESGQE